MSEEIRIDDLSTNKDREEEEIKLPPGMTKEDLEARKEELEKAFPCVAMEMKKKEQEMSEGKCEGKDHDKDKEKGSHSHNPNANPNSEEMKEENEEEGREGKEIESRESEEEEEEREVKPRLKSREEAPRRERGEVLTPYDIRRIVEEVVERTIRKYFQAFEEEAKARGDISSELEDIKKSLRRIPFIEEELQKIRRETERRRPSPIETITPEYTVGYPEPKYAFYYDPYAVMKGYSKYGIYVTVDYDTNVALERIMSDSFDEEYFWYLEYIGPEGQVTEEEKSRMARKFASAIYNFNGEIFVLNKKQPASPAQHDHLLNRLDLYVVIDTKIKERRYDPMTLKYLEKVREVLLKGSEAFLKMTDEEKQRLANKLKEERERIIAGL